MTPPSSLRPGPRLGFIPGSLLALLAFTTIQGATAPAPDPATLLAGQTLAFSYTATGLSGPGADLLRAHAARAQFVLLGEEHMDHEIPIFAAALFTMLHGEHGFQHLVVEQDPVAMEDALAPERRGDVDKIAAHAKKYPTLFEFDSDEDLALLATAGRLEDNLDAIWGVEQATGAVRYLEELLRVAPNPAARQQAGKLMAAARAADAGPGYNVHWLIAESTLQDLADLATAMPPAPASREARLLNALAKSAEIFGYYRRAEAGEYVGLFNNTVREEVLKANFLRRYHAAAKNGTLPKAMFKFGENHLYHGRNPTQAFPIGNLAHELAIVNGHEAYGLCVMALGPGYRSLNDHPAWLRLLLPPTEPTVPTLINLRELRRFQRLFAQLAAPADQWRLRTLINGYDAIVILPNSKPAVKLLGGRGAP